MATHSNEPNELGGFGTDAWGHRVMGGQPDVLDRLAEMADGETKTRIQSWGEIPAHDDRGYASGRRDDRTRRGFMLFGLTCRCDDETRDHVRIWMDAFRLGQMDRGLLLGRGPYEKWEAEFRDVVEARGTSTFDEVRSANGTAMVDWWLDRRVPREAYAAEIRQERPEEVAAPRM